MAEELARRPAATASPSKQCPQTNMDALARLT